MLHKQNEQQLVNSQRKLFKYQQRHQFPIQKGSCASRPGEKLAG